MTASALQKAARNMMYFWAIMAVVSVIWVTVMGVQEGFDTWAMYYGATGICIAMSLFRRWVYLRTKKQDEARAAQAKDGQKA